MKVKVYELDFVNLRGYGSTFINLVPQVLIKYLL